jgi:basic amino acid/polyamine antiporter, APA family
MKSADQENAVGGAAPGEPAGGVGLARAMGRFTLTALVVNAIIGSGVFGLPSVIAKLLGPAAPWAWLIGAVGNGVVMLCFAEVASRFVAAGGAYLYAREALPRLLAIQTGWLAYLTRLTAAAAGANLFSSYLGEFFPTAPGEVVRVGLLTLLLAGLATVNYRGVRGAARLSNGFTIAKLLPLLTFLVVGAGYLAWHGAVAPAAPVSATGGDWLRAVLLIAFAYGGYDGALMAMGEARTPRRDAPFALIAAMLLLTALYTGVQLVVNAALADPGASSRPLADAARVFLGPFGGWLIAAGATISIVGFLGANFLNAPRLTFALAEHGDLPRLFGRIHPRFRTPAASVLIFALLVWILAVRGSFEWNATLSAVSRLFVYGSTCLALLRLRRLDPGGARFRLPGGVLLPVAAIGFCAVLATRMGLAELTVLTVVALVGGLHWGIVRHRSA